MAEAPRLLCIDLQTPNGLTPDARAVFGARQLLAIARRSAWPVIHSRRRSNLLSIADPEARSGVRPLTTERLFLRNERRLSDSPALMDQLDQWSRDTVYVAAFDAVALLSVLIDRLDKGPRFVLIEEAISANLAVTGRAALDPFVAACSSLAPTMTIPALVTSLGYRPTNVVPLDPRMTH